MLISRSSRILMALALSALGTYVLASADVAAAAPARVSIIAPRPSSTQTLIRYSTPNPRADHITLRGKHLGKGCLFSLHGYSSPRQVKSGTVTFYNETAYNPTSCQSLIDVVRIPRANATPSAPPTQTSSEASTGQGAAYDGPDGVATPNNQATCTNPYRDTHHSYSHSACIHSWFHDPPGFHVNDVTNEVQWNPGSGCATHGRAYASGYLQWLTSTGWFLYHNVFIDSFNCHGVVSAYIDVHRSDNAGAIFRNDTFCMATVTYTYYASQITGNPNGSYQWQVDWSKTGLCQNLLTFQAKASP